MTTTPQPPSSKRDSTYVMVRRLVRDYVRPYFGTLGWAILFMLIGAGTTAAFAGLIEPVMDHVMVAQNKGMILPLAAGILLCFFVSGMATYGHSVLMNKVGQNILTDIQRDLFARFMGMDLAFFHANPSGQLLSRIINDVSVMRAAVADALTGIGKSFLTLIFLIGVMFYQDWKLSLIAFTVFPLAAGMVAYVGRRLRKVSGNIQNETAGLSDMLSQIFLGVRQVKAYGMEGYESERAGNAIKRVRNLVMKSVRIGNLTVPVNETLIGLAVFGIVVYGGYKIVDGQTTVGSLMSFIAAFALAYEPIKKLAKLNNSLQMGLGATERVFQMIDMKPAIRNMPNAVELNTRMPEIRLENVVFQYEGGDGPALQGVTLIIPPGKVTALVGPSGGGKSTIMNLIPRFYDVNEGSVSVDGYDIRELTMESLRRHIALVSQDITIFDDTAMANIAYGLQGATLDEVKAAARAAEADTFISALPEGYNTRLGENGLKLSGGQRQRIAIARAILRDAPILLLDEATSALDNESEQAIQRTLNKLQTGRTTLVIAHRLSTVQNADQIIVLKDGKIAEQGKHDDLLAQGLIYARMYQAGLKE